MDPVPPQSTLWQGYQVSPGCSSRGAQGLPLSGSGSQPEVSVRHCPGQAGGCCSKDSVPADPGKDTPWGTECSAGGSLYPHMSGPSLWAGDTGRGAASTVTMPSAASRMPCQALPKIPPVNDSHHWICFHGHIPGGLEPLQGMADPHLCCSCELPRTLESPTELQGVDHHPNPQRSSLSLGGPPGRQHTCRGRVGV